MDLSRREGAYGLVGVGGEDGGDGLVVDDLAPADVEGFEVEEGGREEVAPARGEG